MEHESPEYEPTEYDLEQAEREAEEYEKFEEEYEKYGFPGQSRDHFLKKIPPIIFKYRSLDTSKTIGRTLDIILNHRLYMPKAEKLNDPFEGLNIKYLSDKTIDDYKAIIEDYRVLALSENCFSAPLWAHYAAEGNGLCLGFNTFGSFYEIKKIEYSDSIDKLAWLDDNPYAAAELEYLYKNKEWSYENEYRIAEKGNGEKTQYFPYEESELKTIIFGTGIDPIIKEIIKKIIPSTCKLFDIEADKNAKKYILKKCDESDTKIKTLEDLYNSVLR